LKHILDRVDPLRLMGILIVRIPLQGPKCEIVNEAVKRCSNCWSELSNEMKRLRVRAFVVEQHESLPWKQTGAEIL